MKVLNKITKFFEDRAKYWYIVIAIFIILEVIDYGYVSKVIPVWGCNIITLVLVILATLYNAIMYHYIRNKIKNYMSNRQDILFERIENLQGHIDDLDERNIELEKQLSEALQKSMDENIVKTITELSSVIDKADTNVKNRIQEFEDRMSGKLDKDTENIQKQMAVGFGEQKKLTESNKEIISEQMSAAVVKFDKQIMDCAVKLTDSINEVHKKQLDKTAEFNADMVELFKTQGNCLEEMSDSIEKKIGESAIANASQTEELNSSIIVLQHSMENETQNIVDTALSSMEQLSNLFASEAETESIHNDEMLKVLGKLNSLVVTRGNQTDIAVTDALSRLTALMNKDTEQILCTITDSSLNLSGKMDEKKQCDDKAFENLKEQITLSEEEGKSQITASAEKVKEFISISSEMTRNAISLSSIETENCLSASSEEIKSVVSALAAEQKEAMVVSENNIITVSELARSIRTDVSELNQAIADDTEQLKKQNDAALDFISNKFTDITDTVNNNNSTSIERIYSAETGILQAIIAGKTAGEESENRILAEIFTGGKTNMEVIISEISKVREYQAESLSNKTSAMQNELTKLMIELLDKQEENAEKVKSAYDGIFNQAVLFSNNVKNQIKLLQDSVDSRNGQLSQTALLKDKVDTYSKVSENYQKEISVRLENLQRQVLNLNSLTEVLKNLSVVKMQVSPPVTSKEESKNEREILSDRTEEIKDSESGITVFNHYKNNKLVSSVMRSGKQITYDIEYDAQGGIARSRNYGPMGDVVTELQFHSNGQVKTRIEKVTVNGKVQTVTSQFDEQGNKKS